MSKFYAVALGRAPGIYSTWAECQNQIRGFSNARFKSFPTRAAAEHFIAQHDEMGAKKRKRGASSAATVAYCDGACVNNGRASARAGSGLVVLRDDGRKRVELRSGVPGLATNGRAEIYAAALALQETLDDDDVLVRPDADYVVASITDPTRLDEWRKNGWRRANGREAVANVDLWQLVVKLLDKRRAGGKPAVHWEWVEAHSGHEHNERADKLAESGIGTPVMPIKQ